MVFISKQQAARENEIFQNKNCVNYTLYKTNSVARIVLCVSVRQSHTASFKWFGEKTKEK